MLCNAAGLLRLIDNALKEHSFINVCFAWAHVLQCTINRYIMWTLSYFSYVPSFCPQIHSRMNQRAQQSILLSYPWNGSWPFCEVRLDASLCKKYKVVVLIIKIYFLSATALSLHKLISESILHCRRMKNKISFWTRFMNGTPQSINFVNSYLWFTTLVKIYSAYCMQYNLWHELGLSCHSKALNTRAGLVHWLRAVVLLVSKTVSCLEQTARLECWAVVFAWKQLACTLRHWTL